MLVEIPLVAIPNQQLTFGVNGQTINMTLTSNTVNDKRLRGQNADADFRTITYTFASIFLGTTPIIQSALCNNASYINQYPSSLVGYLFFYVDNSTVGNTNDAINYANFGVTTHLYYSDYDALNLDYNAWILANQPALELKYIFEPIQINPGF